MNLTNFGKPLCHLDQTVSKCPAGSLDPHFKTAGSCSGDTGSWTLVLVPSLAHVEGISLSLPVYSRVQGCGLEGKAAPQKKGVLWGTCLLSE